MAGVFHVDNMLTSTTNFAKDNVHFSFAVVTDEEGPDAADLGGIIAAQLQAAFALDGPGGLSLDQYLGPDVSRNGGACVTRVYDIEGKLGLVEVGGKLRPIPHGSPVSIGLWALENNATDESLPRQVALCITKRALNWEDQPIERPDGVDLQGKVDRPRARYTGRLFLGPICRAGSTAVAGVSKVKLDLRTTANQAIDTAFTELLQLGIIPVVWSRTDATVRPVVQVECDDRWDTQRRRLAAPSAREAVSTVN